MSFICSTSIHLCHNLNLGVFVLVIGESKWFIATQKNKNEVELEMHPFNTKMNTTKPWQLWHKLYYF
jgi:hypothetical protein